jgi:hypothetical protein
MSSLRLSRHDSVGAILGATSFFSLITDQDCVLTGQVTDVGKGVRYFFHPAIRDAKSGPTPSVWYASCARPAQRGT